LDLWLRLGVVSREYSEFLLQEMKASLTRWAHATGWKIPASCRLHLIEV
jgi:hypothetical protein